MITSRHAGYFFGEEREQLFTHIYSVSKSTSRRAKEKKRISQNSLKIQQIRC